MEPVQLTYVDLELLDPNPYLKRLDYPENELKALAQSIREHGVLEPIIVRPKGERYEICAGERRFRASKLAGLKKIPAIIMPNMSDEDMTACGMIENLKRTDLNPIEEAKGFQSLQELDWTQERIAQELDRGLTRDKVAQKLRLLTFPQRMQDLVSHDTITATHAEALARLNDSPALLEEAVANVVEGQLTTKHTENLVEHSLRTEAIKDQVLTYLCSPEFVTQLRYLLNASVKYQHCPTLDCVGALEHETLAADGSEVWDAKVFCKKCGWSYEAMNGPLYYLLERITAIRQCRTDS